MREERRIRTLAALAALAFWLCGLPVSAIFNVPQPGGTPTAAYVANALRNQRELGASIPVDRVEVPAVNVTSTWFNGTYTGERIGNVSTLLFAGYKRLYLDLYYDPRSGMWQLCPYALPVTSTRTTSSRTLASSSTASSLVGNSTGTATLTSSLASRSETAASLSTATALPRFLARQASGTASEVQPTSSSRVTAFSSSTAVFSSTSIFASSSSLLGSTAAVASTTASTASPTPTPLPDEVLIQGTLCSRHDNSVEVLMSSIKDYLDATSVPFYRDLVYLIFSIHSATFYPAETNTTYNSVPQPLHLALGLVGNASGIGPLLFTPIDLYAERQSLNETFGTSPYFRSEAQGVVQINRTFSTANGWPSLGFVLSELDKRVVIGTDTIGSVVGYDMTKDDTWFFSADALNSSVQLNFANTALVTFGNCDYPSATVVMLPTGNETGSSGPVVIDGETALTWSYAFLSDFGIPAGANSTIWNNPVGCGFSPLFVTTPAPSVDSLVAGIWSWDINMPQNGSLANCAVQQRSNGKWTIDSCSSVHPVACQSVLNPEVWVVSKTSNVWTAAATECPSGYFFSVPHTARENYALWKAFQSVPASLEATAVFLDYSSLSHQGCWVSGGPNAFCPYVDRQAIITQIIQTSFQEGIVVLVVFIIFVWFQCRNQFKNVQRRKRRAEVKWKMASEEITTIPA